MNLTEKLDYLLKRVLEVNDEPRVNGGISQSEIENQLNEIDIEPTEDLLELYQWRNGIDYLNAFLYFNSVQYLIEGYRNLEEFDFEVDGFNWDERWLPILNMNGAIDILVNIETRQVAAIDIECDRFEIIASDYNHYIDALVYVFQSNQFYYEDGSCINFNDSVWQELYDKFKVKAAWS